MSMCNNLTLSCRHVQKYLTVKQELQYAIMRALLKGLGTGLLLIAYVVIAGAMILLPAPQRIRRSVSTRTSSFFARIFLVLLGVRVHVKHH